MVVPKDGLGFNPGKGWNAELFTTLLHLQMYYCKYYLDRQLGSICDHILFLLRWNDVTLMTFMPLFPMIKKITYRNGKLHSLYSWTLPKIRIISKNPANKSLWALNFLKKSQWVHMSIAAHGARGYKDWYISNIIRHRNGEVRFSTI